LTAAAAWATAVVVAAFVGVDPATLPGVEGGVGDPIEVIVVGVEVAELLDAELLDAELATGVTDGLAPGTWGPPGTRRGRPILIYVYILY